MEMIRLILPLYFILNVTRTEYTRAWIMRLSPVIIILFRIFYLVSGDDLITGRNEDDLKIEIIAKIIQLNLKNNGWNNIYMIGNLPDTLYSKIKTLPFTFTASTIEVDHEDFEDVVSYHSNVIVINCMNFQEFEDAIRKSIVLPYWHSLANIVLIYHAPYQKEIVSKLFFSFWYYGAVNVVIVHYNGHDESVLISYYSPYVTENYKLDELFGCWTSRKISLLIEKFETSFICVEECFNVSLHSNLRANHLGTCIGFNTHVISKAEEIENLNIFEDKGKDLHGFTMRAYSIQVLPFLEIRKNGNDSYTIHSRDGMFWNTMAELFNFKIDLSPGQDIMKKNFNFEKNIVQLFDFIRRQGDLLLFPLYQFDIIIADYDNTVPFIESGVCILSHRAGYETVVFNQKFLENNLPLIIKFSVCFFCTWFVFFLFNVEQLGRVSCDQAGKDLINTFRTVLSISIYRHPKKKYFRIFIFIAIWSFFVLNFSLQAQIISLFSAYKRGNEVDSFEDVIEKGFKIEGMASPDIILPDTEEKFKLINSKLRPIQDLFECVNLMAKNSQRFCLIDCALGRYLERNMLNENGKQFLHVATKDRIHSHYLNMILHKNSPLTERFNKFTLMMFESGLIRKWMDYRFNIIKEEVPVKAIGMEGMEGIFKCYCFLLGLCVIVFLFELFLGFFDNIKYKIKSTEELNIQTFRNVKIKK